MFIRIASKNMVKPLRRSILKPSFSFQWPVSAETSQQMSLQIFEDILKKNDVRRPRNRGVKGTAPVGWKMLLESAVFGYNRVVKALRKHQLCVAIFDSEFIQKNSALAYFTAILVEQSGPDVAGYAIKNLDSKLSALLRLKSISAVGIMRCQESLGGFFEPLLAFLAENLRPLKIQGSISSRFNSSNSDGSPVVRALASGESPSDTQYVPTSVVKPEISEKKRKKRKLLV